jgi:hypothetical protein
MAGKVDPTLIPDGVVLPPEEPPGWFRRNWMWLVPVGCLLPVLACAGLAGGGLIFAFQMLRQSEPAQAGLKAAAGNEEVRRLLGEPIAAGWLVTGQLRYGANQGGSVNLTLPLRGPKGRGTLVIQGSRANNAWNYDRMDVMVAGRPEAIHLIEPEPEPEEAPPGDPTSEL